MTVDRDKIIQFCEKYLKVKNFEDKCINGLQVEGAEKINKIISGVSFSEQLVKVAIKTKARMLLVHHGLFNKYISHPIQIEGIIKNRLKLLLENDINLCGFHLPLDAHPQIGNNISLCKLFGLINTRPFYVGFIGELKPAMLLSEFIKMVNEKLQTQSTFIAGGPKTVRKIGVISGAASPEFSLAKKLGADTYLSGDIREELFWEVKETKINYVNGWHYNTEKLGIKNLGKLISKKFKISVEFIDIPNEI